MRPDVIRVERINFIEKEPFQFTYRKMLFIGAGLFVLMISLAGLQWIRAKMVEKSVTQLNTEVIHLKVEREELVRQSAPNLVGNSTGAQTELLKVFDTPFSWAGTLRDITAQISRSLWLINVDSSDKESGSLRKGLALKGRAEEASAITSFVKALADSTRFENVVLTSTKQTTGPNGTFYDFSVDLAIRSSQEDASQ